MRKKNTDKIDCYRKSNCTYVHISIYIIVVLVLSNVINNNSIIGFWKEISRFNAAITTNSNQTKIELNKIKHKKKIVTK